MKMCLCLAGWLVLAFTSVAVQADGLVSRSFLDGKVEMLVPAEFEPMGDEMMQIKYPMERRPTEVVTNEAGSFNVAFNHTANAMTQQQLAEAHDAIDKMFHNLYPSATWYRSELTTIHGRKAVVMELLTPAIDTRVHNIIVFTTVDDRMLLVSVNLTEELKDEYLSIARKMVESIHIAG